MARIELVVEDGDELIPAGGEVRDGLDWRNVRRGESQIGELEHVLR